MKFCIYNQLLKTLVKHQIGVRSVEELTQEQLKEYLDNCLKVTNYYIPDLDSIFSELTLSENKDANARVVDLFTQAEEILRRNGLTKVSEKTIVPLIIQATEPALLSSLVMNYPSPNTRSHVIHTHKKTVSYFSFKYSRGFRVVFGWFKTTF